MNNSNISSWVRQCRHKAKKYGLVSDITIDDVNEIIRLFNYKCAYCGIGEYEFLDTIFEISKISIIPANVVTICGACKESKKNHDLLWLFSDGKLSRDRYLEILRIVLKQRGSEIVRNYINKTIGLDDST